MSRVLLSLLLLPVVFSAKSLTDSDLDGVIDELDRCPNTPLSHQVDRYGCTKHILTLPQNSSDKRGYLLVGFSKNSDVDDQKSKSPKRLNLVLNFIDNSWSYTLSGGLYTNMGDRKYGDTILNIKKSFSMRQLKSYIGASIIAPTDDFSGNRVDYGISASLYYYKSDKLSLFGGIERRWINDKPIGTFRFRDSYELNLGVGYFFDETLYANLSGFITKTKYKGEEIEKSLGTTLYKALNPKLFLLGSYIFELHEPKDSLFKLNLGYRIY